MSMHVSKSIGAAPSPPGREINVGAAINTYLCYKNGQDVAGC